LANFCELHEHTGDHLLKFLTLSIGMNSLMKTLLLASA
jgi:hypothetical protein